LRQRLYALEMMLQSMRQDLDSADAAGVELKPRSEGGGGGLDADLTDSGSSDEKVVELGSDAGSSSKLGAGGDTKPSDADDGDAGWTPTEAADSGNGATRQAVKSSAEDPAG
jgi:hypothetical protein